MKYFSCKNITKGDVTVRMLGYQNDLSRFTTKMKISEPSKGKVEIFEEVKGNPKNPLRFSNIPLCRSRIQKPTPKNAVSLI